MAKLSVYNTIDRSQLGGKFVPLIQSGVSNYKILASDLGKEYHPGDAIDITDIGKINVKFRPDEFSVSSEGLNIKTDYDRGVFKGSDGIYIASADSTINVSVSGIKVNRSNLVSRISGAGLKAVGEMIDVNPADDTIDVGMDGIRVNTSALSIPNAHSLAGSGLESVDSNTLYVKSANGTINVSSLGIKVNTSFLAGRYLRSDSNHGITVDTAPLAHAITGSGLVETNGLIGVNVNTATGIIVNDNKLYLNAGVGLHTTNNTVRVKAANNSIGVSSAGIKVDTYYLAGHGLSSYYGTLLCVHSADEFIKVVPTGVGLHYQNLISRLSNSSGGSSNIKIAYNYLYTAIGDGLRWGSNSAIYVRSADDTINVNGGGISVNPGYSLSSTSVGLEVNPSNDTLIVDSGGVSVNTSYLAGYGLSSVSNSLEVKPADNTITVGPDGIKVNKSALSIPTASSLVGSGLTSRGSYLYVQSVDGSIGVGVDGIKVNAASGLETTPNGLYVKSADDTIYVSSAGIKVNTLEPLVGLGLEWSGAQALYVKSADSTIEVSDSGIRVHTSQLAGYGLSATSNGLYVHSADGTIGVTSSGIGVNVTNGGGILTGTDGLYVDSGKLAGKGLMAHTEMHNVKLNVKVGSGLTFDDQNRLRVYAGSGLEFDSTNPHSRIRVKSVDNSLVVGPDGLYIDPGSGLSKDVSGLLCIKSSDGSIVPTWEGLAVDIRNAAYIGAGLTTANGDLKVKNADSSLIVDSAGARVNLGYGLGLDESGGLACLVSHGVDGANWYKKYQDGWIEQGGYFSSNSQEATVTLNTAFSNTNYTLMVTCRTAGSSPNYNPAIFAKTTTSFTYNSMIAKAFGAEYYACGY